ncbi:hypothetical protein LX36DRAFT_664614 [Colletotrichum falcatum]|nr:hypothetical protein LX36DRAFT_664614 [Colletotrichum falcatum]
MLSKTVIAIAALAQVASATSIFCGLSPGVGCPSGTPTACLDPCGDCSPFCFGASVTDIGALCCGQSDGSVNVYCFPTGSNTCG